MNLPSGIASTRMMMAKIFCSIVMIITCAISTVAQDLLTEQEVLVDGGGTTVSGFVPKLSRVLDEQQWSNARLLQRRESNLIAKQQQSTAATDEMDNEQQPQDTEDDDGTTEEERELDTDTSAVDDDLGNGDIDLSFRPDIEEESASDESSSSCKSIIAVNGWRLLASSKNSSSYDVNTLYPDDDVTLPYNDSSTVLPTDEEFVCEMSNGRTLPIRGTDEQVAELRHLLNKGHLISALSSIEVNTPQGISDGDGTTISTSGYSSHSVTLPDGPIKLTSNSGADAATTGEMNRRLSSVYEGTKRALIVRVTDRDGLAVPEDAETISDKFFGTDGDTSTIVSGFRRCSFGKLQMSNNYGTDYYDDILAAPGVMELSIGVRLQTSTQEEIAESAQRALALKLGHELPGPFHHIAFVLEGCYPVETTCEFAAYAFVNHWLSVFVGENFKFPAVAMHEFGHNMNLAHSGGTDGEIYTDHTCLMGNPLFSDDVGMMCFNPAKNYQISVGSGR